MFKKTILVFIFSWAFLPLSHAGDLNKTWYLRYQEIPDFSQVVISVGWSYNDLTGKEAKLYKKGILVLNQHNQEAGVNFKKRVKLGAYDIQTEVILENDPKVTASYQLASKLLAQTKRGKEVEKQKVEVYKPSGMKLFPRVKIHIDGRLKADLRLGEVMDGEMMIEGIYVNAEPGHISVIDYPLNNVRMIMFRGKEHWLKNNQVITDQVFQKAIEIPVNIKEALKPL